MTYSDAKEVLKRIKANYQSFAFDDYVLKEWYKELKDYDLVDVMDKLEQHMRSEEYGSTMPKLYFLTKYIQKTSEKNLHTKYLIQCSMCGNYIDEDKFDEHYGRCLDVDYIVRIRKQYFNVDISDEMQERFKKMEQSVFDMKYLEFLNSIYDKVPHDEQQRIEFIINPKKAPISVQINQID